MRERKKLWLIVISVVMLGGLSVWVNSPKHPGIRVGQLERDLNVRLGLDLQGGSHLIYRADLSGISSDDTADALAGVRDVIERRVNTFGISEPQVRTNKSGDEHRVIVELAGVHDPNAAIEMIGATPQLDFRREVGTDEALEQFNIDDPASLTGPVFERTELTGKNLRRSSVSFDQVSSQPQVNLEFDGEGADIFAELTRNNLGKRLAIYLDGVPISAPVVQSEITNGQAVISGGFSLPEAKQLSQRLNAGALPVPIELIGQQTIGPSLGSMSVERSVRAGIIGLVAVAIWMVLYYRLPGIIASVALLVYAMFFLALVRLIPITLTLAGVAGFILTVGMAVDANVLIFERFKENLRAGRTVPYALRDGFEKAWDSIRASNVSSLLTAVVLYAFGTSIVRGFAITFGVGVLLSMITAIVITRTLLFLVLSSKIMHKPALIAVKDIRQVHD
jgi:protein-export membrane protein SecD